LPSCQTTPQSAKPLFDGLIGKQRIVYHPGGLLQVYHNGQLSEEMIDGDGSGRIGDGNADLYVRHFSNGSQMRLEGVEINPVGVRFDLSNPADVEAIELQFRMLNKVSTRYNVLIQKIQEYIGCSLPNKALN